MIEILPFYWPTKKLILDDNQTFLDALESRINKNSNAEFTTKAIDSLEKLQKQDFNFRWYEQETDKDKYSIDYSTISNIANNPIRYELYSTLVIDHDMPEINGIDFCKKLPTKSGIRKIMLTGNLDYKSGVAELNSKVVDSFLAKDDLNGKILNELIDSEERLFFQNNSKPILEYLRKKDPNSLIFSGDYKKFFDRIIKDYDIQEYYLLNSDGYFLLIDRKGNKKCLFLFSEDYLLEMYEEAEYRLLDKEFCEDIKNRKKALCYHGKANVSWPSAGSWNQHIHKISEVQINGNNCYFAVVDV